MEKLLIALMVIFFISCGQQLPEEASEYLNEETTEEEQEETDEDVKKARRSQEQTDENSFVEEDDDDEYFYFRIFGTSGNYHGFRITTEGVETHYYEQVDENKEILIAIKKTKGLHKIRVLCIDGWRPYRVEYWDGAIETNSFYDETLGYRQEYKVGNRDSNCDNTIEVSI